MTSTKLNFAIALAAIFTQTWLNLLNELSQIAAALMPFCGLALIIMQIIKLSRSRK